MPSPAAPDTTRIFPSHRQDGAITPQLVSAVRAVGAKAHGSVAGIRRQPLRRYTAVTCWSIFILIAITLTACTVTQPPMGPSTSHGTGSGKFSCPTPTVPAQAITPPASPPAMQGTSKTTSDGLQEIDVKVGCGAAVQVGQTVIVEYTGWVQGTNQLFDSSFEHQPSDCDGTVANTCGFALSQGNIIQGWIEGVTGMKVGGTRRLIVPPALAYGAAGSPPSVPGNATLIFDITIVGIQ